MVLQKCKNFQWLHEETNWPPNPLLFQTMGGAFCKCHLCMKTLYLFYYLLFCYLRFSIFIYLYLHIYLIYDEYSLSHCLSALCCSILTAYYILDAFFKYKCIIIKYLIQTCLCLKKMNLWFHCKKTILLYHHHHHYISSHSAPTWCNASLGRTLKMSK